MCIRDRLSAAFYLLLSYFLPANTSVAVETSPLNTAPVSYTHLDVYKRQLLPHRKKQDGQRPFRSLRLHEDGGARGRQHLSLIHI